MSVKKTDPELIRDDGPVKFVGNKESRFQPDLSGRRPYYSVVKHSKFGPSMQNKFMQDFESQVVPLQLVGTEISSRRLLIGDYLVSEVGMYLLTEDDKRLKPESE
jgi:hypothetical protein